VADGGGSTGALGWAVVGLVLSPRVADRACANSASTPSGENDADASVVMNYVAAHPDRFDPQRLGVGGHSMGGAIALLATVGGLASNLKNTLNQPKG